MKILVTAPVGARRNLLVKLITVAQGFDTKFSTNTGSCHNHLSVEKTSFYPANSKERNKGDNVGRWSPTDFDDIIQQSTIQDDIIISLHIDNDALPNVIKNLPDFKILYVYVDNEDDAEDAVIAWLYKDWIIDELKKHGWGLDRISDVSDKSNVETIFRTNKNFVLNAFTKPDMKDIFCASFAEVKNDPIQIVKDFLPYEISNDKLERMREIVEEYDSKQHLYKDWYNSL